ncbi:MAG: ATP-binding cassette domain-containing protein [Chloroflexi bacterium]|nr:ATP-binding cassette domain-containing protein [Chloroflexota bacterium]
MRQNAIVVRSMSKAYGKVQALDDVSLDVAAGTIHGLLGPNGAGKTTLVRILTTLLPPDSGRAWVAGFDVEREATQLRSKIGLAGQSAAVDEYLTGRENLELVGRLYHLDRSTAGRRAAELLERFDLTEAADRRSKTYSGGMRRRLDLAASLVADPEVLLLDEPTTGLDPRARRELWAVIRQLVSDGTTVLLTTQYLEEADELADRITLVDLGRVIAEGTAQELKQRTHGDVLSVVVNDPAQADAALGVIAGHGSGDARINDDGVTVTMPVAGGAAMLAAVIRDLDDAGVEISDIGVRRPSLDDVFLALTGHTAGADRAE